MGGRFYDLAACALVSRRKIITVSSPITTIVALGTVSSRPLVRTDAPSPRQGLIREWAARLSRDGQGTSAGAGGEGSR